MLGVFLNFSAPLSRYSLRPPALTDEDSPSASSSTRGKATLLFLFRALSFSRLVLSRSSFASILSPFVLRFSPLRATSAADKCRFIICRCRCSVCAVCAVAFSLLYDFSPRSRQPSSYCRNRRRRRSSRVTRVVARTRYILTKYTRVSLRARKAAAGRRREEEDRRFVGM